MAKKKKPRTPKVRAFRLLEGKHHVTVWDEKTGKAVGRTTYQKGDVVEATNDLCKLFPNKFQSVNESELAVIRDVAAKKADRRKKEAAKKKRQEEAARVAAEEEEQVEEEDDLELDAATEDDDEEEDEEEEEVEPLGDDVTANYPQAVASELLVFSTKVGNATKFLVAKGDAPGTPLNPNDKAFTKKQLAVYLEDYDEEE